MNKMFEFIAVDTLLDDINREDCFDTREMDGVSPNFRILLATECPTDFSKCIDEDGTLITPYDLETDTGVNIAQTENSDDGLVSMLWSKGVNRERAMSISETMVTYDLGVIPQGIKGAFLVSVNNGSGYVIAYSINNKEIFIDGTFISPINGMIWSIRYDE